MDPGFWHQRWAKNEIGFHEPKANPLLVTHFNKLSLPKGGRVFVPLCGKTLDIAWLLSQGYRVAGAELSEVAISQLFADLGVEPQISTIGALTYYRRPDLDIFVGNLFDLSGGVLGAVDAVYDRAALVALPESMRARYTAHLVEITNRAP
jgi:thiopurine S-methyltransferase